ncbi:hypothetical protein BH11CYA1_BH11CYA1_42360 [soil metagenome]
MPSRKSQISSIAAKSRRIRGANGQTLIEAMVGFIVLIPIALFAVDVVAVMSTAQTNEQWAETAARAAGSCDCETMATNAVKNSLKRFVPTSIISSVELEKMTFDQINGQVTVATVMQINVPIPLPGMNHFEFRASAIQPLLGTPAAQ